MTSDDVYAAFVERLRGEVREIQEHLDHLESGDMFIRVDGKDITQDEIASLKMAITGLNQVIARHT